MKNILRSSLFAVACGLISIPAMAQSAPIRIGPGGSTYQTEPTAEALMARQTARITELEAQISRLTGRIEDLEFRLAERERNFEDVMTTNRTLMDQMGRFDERIDELESRADRAPPPSTSSPFGNRSSSSSTPSSTAGPRPLTGSTGEGRVVSNFPGPQDNSPMREEREAESLAGGQESGSLGTLPASDLPGEAGPLFELGKNRLLNFDYGGAEAAFRGFLDEFGEDPQAGEAHYWLGEILYHQGNYAGSARFLTTFVRDYPSDARRGEGVVKLARALREVGETEQACAFLGRLKQVDPDASARTVEAANVQSQLAGCN